MDEAHVVQIAQVLSEWNPLAMEARTLPDLDGHRTEAIDIIATFDNPLLGGSQ